MSEEFIKNFTIIGMGVGVFVLFVNIIILAWMPVWLEVWLEEKIKAREKRRAKRRAELQAKFRAKQKKLA